MSEVFCRESLTTTGSGAVNECNRLLATSDLRLVLAEFTAKKLKLRHIH